MQCPKAAHDPAFIARNTNGFAARLREVTTSIDLQTIITRSSITRVAR
jgi:hypothetical protein